jgi:hypothetical protein
VSFSGWLRENAEHYLMTSAQDRVAAASGYNRPRPPRGLAQVFWLRVFAPVYRSLPWKLRQRVMITMPGSHRKAWAWEPTRRGPAV